MSDTFVVRPCIDADNARNVPNNRSVMKKFVNHPTGPRSFSGSIPPDGFSKYNAGKHGIHSGNSIGHPISVDDHRLLEMSTSLVGLGDISGLENWHGVVQPVPEHHTADNH